MIDWHSHVLPKMDDGSRDAAESVSMLNALSGQGTDTVIATPHFYANDESVDSFLQRRQSAYELLMTQLPENAPQIRLGAEVSYYQGIAGMADLKKLRIEGTRMILLEMPSTKWTEYIIKELTDLATAKGMTVVLAHIERFLSMQSSKTWDRLYECGIRMQVNASFFNERSTRRLALSLLKKGNIHFIGSDCHNMTTRPPRLGEALGVIEKKFGKELIDRIHRYGASVLC